VLWQPSLPDEPRWPSFFDAVRRTQPDAIVIACSKIPSHAREAARYLGDGFNTRNIPVILVDVREHDIEKTERTVRRAKIVERDRLSAAIGETLAQKSQPAPTV